MIDVFIRVHKIKPSESWQSVQTYKNEEHLKESIEILSNKIDVVKVEVIPIPDRNDKPFNEYIKDYFNA